jgi:hypothetical protein
VLFFVVSLVICLLLSVLLLAGLGRSLRTNWTRKNRRPISYLAPVGLTVAFLILAIWLAVPRVLDVLALVSGDCVREEIQAEEGQVGWCTWRDGKRHFTFNPWQYQITAGKSYNMTYTPHSFYIVALSEISEGETDATAEQPGDGG